MADSTDDHELRRAIAGDKDALERLLLGEYAALIRFVEPRIPADLRGVLSADDVLQDSFVLAFRDVGQFDPSRGIAFGAWLRGIVDHRMMDSIRYLRRKKRGGAFRRKEKLSDPLRSSIKAFIETVLDDEDTPSQIVAKDEAIDAMQVAIDTLPDDQRTAVKLRFLMHKSVEETAEQMNRTVDAVRGLLHRAKQTLRCQMEESVKWLSRKD